MALNPSPRNPGPSWGFRFLTWADAWLPSPLFNGLLGAGTAVAVAAMPAARGHSRKYLAQLRGRPARGIEVWRHFFSFARSLVRSLRAGRGRPPRCQPGIGFEAFFALVNSGRPALFGTFHFGDSDLIGFLLPDFHRHIAMVRQRVANSSDTDELGRQFGQWVRFIWSNDTEGLLFALKSALDAGDSIALKCDRPEHSARLEAFYFLGARRLFPFTIYHLAFIFRLPVVFCLGLPLSRVETAVVSSPVFEPGDSDKEAGLARAREHFQGVLTWLEASLRQNPYLWFNFTPLNPESAC